MSRKAYYIFLFALVFSPAAFGAVETWSLTVMECSSFAALLFLLIAETRKRDATLYEVPGIIPLTCLLAYNLIQLIPLPPGFVRLFSPGTYYLYASTVGLAGKLGWISLSINRKEAVQEFFRLVSYAAFYVLTIQLLSRREPLKKTVMVVIGFAAVLSLLSILQHLFNNGKIYWLRSVSDATPFGPFVDRDHYAGFMEMILPVALAVFLAYKPAVRYNSLRKTILESLNRKDTNTYLLLGLATVLIATSILVTLSRGGILSLCVSMIFFGFMVTRLKANRGARVLILTVFVLIFLIVAWLGWGPVLDRFGEIKDVRGAVTDVRTIMWKDGFNIARDFPLTGTGAGSFASIYPKYRTLMEAGSVEHAHNDYLEMFAEGGIIAFLLASCYGFSLLYKSYKSFIMRKETYSTYLYIGSLTGIIAILVHSLVDFNLHIGSNGLYFFFIAGLAVAAANTRLRKDHSYLKLLKPSRCRVALVLTSFLLVAVLSFNVGLILGRMQFSLIDNFRPGRDIDKKDIMAVRDDIRMASLFDPLESWYPFIGAKFDTLLSNKESARHQFLNALKLEPANGEYLQRVGLLFDDMHNADTAEKFLKAGIAFDRSNPERYQAYASWLFEKGKRQDALAVIKKVVFLYPDLAGEYIDFMSHNGIEDGEMRSELPERMASYLALGDYMDSKGREDDAENAYQCALSFARNADIRDKSYFLRVANYYEKRGLLEKALYVMRLARAYLPKDAGIHLASGELYERLRMNNMAAEEYRSASILDPVNPDARNKLAGLRGGN